MKKVFCARLLIAVCCFGGVSSATAQERLVLKGEVIEEKIHDRTLISKPGWLRGVHIVGAVQATSPQLVSVLPSGWSEFCGKLTSIGGDYTATVQFVTSPSTAGARTTELEFDAQFDFPSEATHETGGVVLEEGRCISNSEPDGIRRFIASFWNESPEPKVEQGLMEIVLNMNVARAERLQHVASLGTKTLNVDCEKLRVSDALAFNYRCSVFVPQTSLSEMADMPLRFQYQRFYRGRLSNPRMAEIFVGADQ